MPPDLVEQYIAALRQIHRGGDGEHWAECWGDWAGGPDAGWIMWYRVGGIPLRIPVALTHRRG